MLYFISSGNNNISSWCKAILSSSTNKIERNPRILSKKIPEKKHSTNSSGYGSPSALSEDSGNDAVTIRAMDTNVSVGGLKNGVKVTVNFNVGQENPLQIHLY